MPSSLLKPWMHLRRKAIKADKDDHKRTLSSSSVTSGTDEQAPTLISARNIPISSSGAIDGKSSVASMATTVAITEVTTKTSSPGSTIVSSSFRTASHGQKSNPDSFHGDNDPLGLTVLYAPSARTVDILFIHGLGGTSLRTWCWERDLAYLWPKLWLPRELPMARILTFGYDANFSRKKQVLTTIGDFANDLLFRMKYTGSTTERLGQVPIIVVAHSMGGLVFKKAFVQGHSNKEFSEIVSMIKAVLFLATPHRGSDLANMLNKLLSIASPLGHTPKNYITELSPSSLTLNELNNAFRYYALKLQIFSFYETIATTIGLVAPVIVEKWSALTGYPNEKAAPLIADHHTVCKFASPQDSNYISVIGALRGALDTILSDDCTSSGNELQEIASFLGVPEPPEEDLAFFSSLRVDGTCEGVFECQEFSNWLDSDTTQLLWFHAPPGSGKSTACSFIIERLFASGYICSYFFFRYGQSHKQSPKDMLLSLAYQTAQQVPEFRRSLIKLARSVSKVAVWDAGHIWRMMFSRLLAQIELTDSIFWIIDGIDESESSREVVQLLSQTSRFKTRIKILVLSRPLKQIELTFRKVKNLNVVTRSFPDNREDIRIMVAGEIDYLPCGDVDSEDEFKEHTIEAIIEKSQGNFLWATLVTQQVLKCHRQEQINKIIETMPTGMEQLYDRMMDNVTRLHIEEDRAFAQLLLTWATYAKTPITFEELSEAYPDSFKSIMDIRHAVMNVCGQFVIIDTQGRITLVHHSAREYLEKRLEQQPFKITIELAHEQLFLKCLTTLIDGSLKNKLQQLAIPRFLSYSSRYWMAHLQHCAVDSHQVFDALVNFFTGPYPLTWIQYLAMSGVLSELYTASTALRVFLGRRRSQIKKQPDNFILHLWAEDLMNLPARFDQQLSQCPELIYTCIPSVCPTSSAIHTLFAGSAEASLSVLAHGDANKFWADCLANIEENENHSSSRIQAVASSASHLAIALGELSKSRIVIRDTAVFREQKSLGLDTEDSIKYMSFNDSGSMLACLTKSKVWVWKVTDWSLKITAENPHHHNDPEWGRFVQELRFNNEDDLLLTSINIVHEERSGSDVVEMRTWKYKPLVYRMRVNHPSPRWEQLALALPECGPDRIFMHLSDDCTRVAIAYLKNENQTTTKSQRSNFISVYALEPPVLEHRKPLRFVMDFTWHPSGSAIFGYDFKPMSGTQLYRWDFETQKCQEVSWKLEQDLHPASAIRCNPNGRTILTGMPARYTYIYDASSLYPVHRLKLSLSYDSTSLVCFAPDGSRVYEGLNTSCSIWESPYLDGLSGGSHSDQEKSNSLNNETENGQGISIVSLNTTQSSDTAQPKNTRLFPSAAETAPYFIEPGWTSDSKLVIASVTAKSLAIWYPDSSLEYTIQTGLPSRKFQAITWGQNCSRLVTLIWGEPSEDNPRVVNIRVFTIHEALTTAKFAETVFPAVQELTFHTGSDRRGLIRQVFVNAMSDRLLFHQEQSFSRLLSLPSGEVLAQYSAQEDQLTVGRSTIYLTLWFQHPSEETYLLRLTPTSATVVSWENLSDVLSIPLNLGSILPPEKTEKSKGRKKQERPATKVKFMLSRKQFYNHCPELILLSLEASMLEPPKNSDMRRRTYTRLELYDRDIFLPLQPLYSGSAATSGIPFVNSIRPIPFSRKFMNRVFRHPLGLLPDGRLVFLDKQLWVCTVALLPLPSYCPHLPADDAKVERHFFLPSYWVREVSLSMCRLLRDGRLLFPVGDNFVLIRGIN